MAALSGRWCQQRAV